MNPKDYRRQVEADLRTSAGTRAADVSPGLRSGPDWAQDLEGTSGRRARSA